MNRLSSLFLSSFLALGVACSDEAPPPPAIQSAPVTVDVPAPATAPKAEQAPPRARVSVGPSGIMVRERGETVSVGAGGVVVHDRGDRVAVGSHGVAIRDRNGDRVTVSADGIVARDADGETAVIRTGAGVGGLEIAVGD
jgi:hypothetical protein